MDSSYPPVQHINATVTVTTRNTAASLMGGLAILMGILALVFSWIPFLGIVAIPFGAIGGLLALIGFIVSACHGFKSWVLPVIGAFLCLCAIFVCVIFTGLASSALSDEMAKQKATQEAQEKKLRAAFSTLR